MFGVHCLAGGQRRGSHDDSRKLQRKRPCCLNFARITHLYIFDKLLTASKTPFILPTPRDETPCEVTKLINRVAQSMWPQCVA